MMALRLHGSRLGSGQGHKLNREAVSGADFMYAGIWRANQDFQLHSNKLLPPRYLAELPNTPISTLSSKRLTGSLRRG